VTNQSNSLKKAKKAKKKAKKGWLQKENGNGRTDDS